MHNRREFLWKSGSGFGSLALMDLLARDAAGGTNRSAMHTLPHYPNRAKRVVFFFMTGGPRGTLMISTTKFAK